VSAHNPGCAGVGHEPGQCVYAAVLQPPAQPSAEPDAEKLARRVAEIPPVELVEVGDRWVVTSDRATLERQVRAVMDAKVHPLETENALLRAKLKAAEDATTKLPSEIYEAIRQRFDSKPIPSGPCAGDLWWDWLAVYLKNKIGGLSSK